MNNMKYNLSLKIVKVLNVALLVIPFFVSCLLYYTSSAAAGYQEIESLSLAVLFALLYVIFGKVYDGFLVSLNRISEMVYSQALAAVISDVIMYMVICLMRKGFCNPFPLIGVFVCQILLSTLWSVLAHKWYFAKFPPKKSAVIYDLRQGIERLIGEYGMDKKFDVRMVVSVDECLNDLGMLKDMDAVFLSGVHSHDRNIILKFCVEHGVNVYVIPRVGDVLMSGATQKHMFHLPMLQVGRYNPSPLYLFVKRLFDIVACGIAIVILSPIFIVTAIAIKATDGGPVFYRQCRLTKDGKRFDVLKFRSMRVDAEKDGVARLSTGENDDRITSVGKIIRKVRIDELPQLITILLGDMTICGPRPERPEIAEQYEVEMPEFRLRLQAKAGLTGYAQVYGKYNTTPYDKLQMDLMYIAHPSFLEDLRIMFATVKILFMPESTEGVSEGQTTAMSGEKH